MESPSIQQFSHISTIDTVPFPFRIREKNICVLDDECDVCISYSPSNQILAFYVNRQTEL